MVGSSDPHQVGVDVSVVEFCHGFEWKQFVGKSVAVHVWLEVFDDFVDDLVVFHVVLYDVTE